MKRAVQFIARYLAVWSVLGAVLAYLYPAAFAWTSIAVGGVPLFKWMFVLTMFSVGTVIDSGSFVALARKPHHVALGLLTQFTVMPGLAWLAVSLGGFHADIALGFIIVGCAPGAMTSNVLTYLARGDTAFSVTLTTFASLAAVVVTPAFVLLLAGETLGMSIDKFWEQLWTILWTVAMPLLLGLALRRATPRARPTYELLGPAVAALSIVVICCFVTWWTRDEVGAAASGSLVGVAIGVVVLNALGFAAGAALGRLYGFDRPRSITLSIEVGMQNAGMGVVLASSTFQDRPGVAVPAAFFTIWCIVTAAGLILVLERRRGACDRPR